MRNQIGVEFLEMFTREIFRLEDDIRISSEEMEGEF